MATHGDLSASQDHLVLPYISRILMEEEEDVDDDHPALLHAQRPFAQILVSSSGTLASALLADQGDVLAGETHTRSSAKDNGGLLLLADDEYSTDMFFKGMEEASKFLPTHNKLTTGGQGERNEDKHGGGDELEAEVGRKRKLVVAEPVEARAHKVFDQMTLSGYHQVRFAMENEVAGNKSRKERKKRGAAQLIDLHSLLLHCAKAVMDDRQSAGELLKEIKQHASPIGDATQRLAYWFAEALEARLTGTGSQVHCSPTRKCISAAEYLKAYQLFMSTCCFWKVAFFFANKAIFNASMGRSRLHIVDYSLHHGFQWPELLRWLAARDGGPPEVMITHIDLPQPGFHHRANHTEETGNWLTNIAREFGVPFKYHVVMAQGRTVCIEDLDIEVEPDEALTMNELFNFRTLMDESVAIAIPSPRDVVLNKISKMKPHVFVQGIVNGSYGTFFLSRFRDILFYHSALFDMLDSTMPRESQLRLDMERDVFGWVALNAIAYEGEDRVERSEPYKRWQARNKRAGLRQLPLNRETVKMVRDMVKNNYHKDFFIDEDRQWLLQGWKGRTLFAHSTWVADHAGSHC